jgi:Protein of unknown function (DUF642)/PEP-CTERM motif
MRVRIARSFRVAHQAEVGLMKFFATTAAMILLLAPAARADLVTNGSFEAGTNPPTGEGDTQAIGTSNITGWTIVNNDGTTVDNGKNVLWINNGSYGLSTPFGNDFLDLTGTTDSTPYDGVVQTITTVSGQQYVLTFDLGVSTNGGPFSGTISVSAGINGSGTTFTDDGSTGTLTSDNTLWTDESLPFTATSASTVVSFIGETDSAGEFIGLDNVSVNPAAPASVPEPASMALIGVGLAGIGVIRRRRSAR